MFGTFSDHFGSFLDRLWTLPEHFRNVSDRFRTVSDRFPTVCREYHSSKTKKKQLAKAGTRTSRPSDSSRQVPALADCLLSQKISQRKRRKRKTKTKTRTKPIAYIKEASLMGGGSVNQVRTVRLIPKNAHLPTTGASEQHHGLQLASGISLETILKKNFF